MYNFWWNNDLLNHIWSVSGCSFHFRSTTIQVMHRLQYCANQLKIWVKDFLRNETSRIIFPWSPKCPHTFAPGSPKKSLRIAVSLPPMNTSFLHFFPFKTSKGLFFANLGIYSLSGENEQEAGFLGWQMERW